MKFVSSWDSVDFVDICSTFVDSSVFSVVPDSSRRVRASSTNAPNSASSQAANISSAVIPASCKILSTVDTSSFTWDNNCASVSRITASCSLFAIRTRFCKVSGCNKSRFVIPRVSIKPFSSSSVKPKISRIASATRFRTVAARSAASVSVASSVPSAFFSSGLFSAVVVVSFFSEVISAGFSDGSSFATLTADSFFVSAGWLTASFATPIFCDI